MTEKRFRELKSLEKMMTTIPGFDKSKKRIPKCCKECEFYQPQWKYRSCYHVRCPYHLKGSTIRRTPLEHELFPLKEVVVMNDI